jgi:hypothetical protein
VVVDERVCLVGCFCRGVFIFLYVWMWNVPSCTKVLINNNNNNNNNNNK